MANEIISSRRLAQALQAEGLLPPNCSLIEVIVNPTGAPLLRYSVWVGKDDLPKLARALLHASDDATGAAGNRKEEGPSDGEDNDHDTAA